MNDEEFEFFNVENTDHFELVSLKMDQDFEDQFVKN